MNPIQIFHQEIKSILKLCNRERDEVLLVIASKYFNIQQILKLYHMGQRDFGENRVQDALEKIKQLPDDIRWHFIGHLQINKVNKVIDKFDLIHSIDSYECAKKISDKSQRPQKILIQINTSDETTKSGFSKREFFEQLPLIEKLPHIKVEGLMTMAAHTDDTDKIRQSFRDLAEVRATLEKEHWQLSMGMSDDYKIALQEGTTLLRIGRRFL